MSEITINKIINEKLTGDAQRNALELADFLQENEFELEANDDSFGGWAVGGVVGNSIGFLLINGEPECPGPWTLWFNTCDFEDTDQITGEIKETVWQNISPCGKCHQGWETCGNGDRTIFGKEFKRLCHSPLMFTNPDSETLAIIKQLLMIKKEEI